MTNVESLIATNSDELIPDCLESLIDNGYGSAGLELELRSVLRQLLNQMIPDRWFFASLMSLARRLADRLPDQLQPLAGPSYSLVQRHNELLGIASVWSCSAVRRAIRFTLREPIHDSEGYQTPHQGRPL
jgi:hypothetical protein